MRKISLVFAATMLLSVAARATTSKPCVDIGGVDKPAGGSLNGMYAYAATTGPVIATFEGAESCYSDTLMLASSGMEIFNNHSSLLGDEVLLGNFNAGDLIPLSVYVSNLDLTFFPGPGDANADGAPHFDFYREAGNVLQGRIEDLLAPNFEGNTDFGDDLAFKLSNTTNVPPPAAVPEPMSMLLTGAGGALLFIGSRLKKRALRSRNNK